MFIVKINFNEKQHPFYYALAKEDGWEEIYNPHFATQFKTAEEATEWMKTKTTFEEYMIVVGAESTIKKFDKWISGPAIRRTFNYPSKELNVKYDPEKQDKYDILDWRFKLKNEDDSDITVQYEVYKSYPSLYEVFECLWEVNRYSEYPYKEYFISVQMRVGENTSFKTFTEELDLVIDRINYRNKDGHLTISIFDRFCGEGGNFAYFEIRDGGKYAITGRHWEYIEGTLEEVFNYWKKERYYD